MIYIKQFNLPNESKETNILLADRRNIYNNYYPLHLFSTKNFTEIKFENITIFSGDNGCGKTTLLNIIALKLEAVKKNNFSKGNLFREYTTLCSFEKTFQEEAREIKMITSDDVFDNLLDIRCVNTNIDRRKERLSKEYLDLKYSSDYFSFENYEQLKNKDDANRKTMSKYVRERLGNNCIIESSNGESSLFFWQKEINENGIYILDEPENSLSAKNQLKLKKYIEESVRFFNCQFIISTHSPFLLALNDAKIYNIKDDEVEEVSWKELDNIKIYKDFFDENY